MSKKKGQKTGLHSYFAWCFREQKSRKIQRSKKRRVIFVLHDVAVVRVLFNNTVCSCVLEDRVKKIAREKSRIGLKDSEKSRIGL